MNKQHIPIYLSLLFIVFVGTFFIFEFFAVTPKAEAPTITTPLSIATTTPLVFNVSDHHVGTYTRTEVDYPQFMGELEVLNAPIATLITEGIKEHDKASMENWKARAETADPRGSISDTPSQAELFPYHATWSLMQFDAERVSVLVEYDEFSGGAHGSGGVHTFNYDLKQHRVVAIDDIVGGDISTLEKLSADAIALLIEERKRTLDESVLSPVEIQWINDGAGAKYENFENFTIHGNRITFYFSDYQVGPHAIGMPTITLPFPLQ
ncbi:MAG TPA: RsiV family protein [Candidatus Paceibacterota bacterium]|nr:RsiV family protein [Candidatus Paceibacterota bacterium]